MFTIMNRLRGSDSIYAKVNALLVMLITQYAFNDITVSLLVGIGYLLGESFGWGKWIGSIIRGVETPTEGMINSTEGTKNGIHFLANYIFNQETHYQKYCNTALAIRGFYWAFLTMLPLFVFGYLGFIEFHILSLIIGIFFPISIHVGKWSTTKFNYDFGWITMQSAWEHAEVWYGIVQDIILIYLILNI